jgi:hypothetical protein
MYIDIILMHLVFGRAVLKKDTNCHFKREHIVTRKAAAGALA